MKDYLNSVAARIASLPAFALVLLVAGLLGYVALSVYKRRFRGDDGENTAPKWVFITQLALTGVIFAGTIFCFI